MMALHSYRQPLLCLLLILACVAAQTPAQIYDGGQDHGNSTPISIKVGTGGAGQSGILKALSDAFINESIDNGSSPFRIAWYQSDTFVTIRYLESATVDVGITYNEVAEQISIDQGIALDPSYYLWRDHFQLVGPKANPASLSKNMTVSEMFLALYIAGESTVTSNTPVRFLTRYDKSATNVKESQQWIRISQTPWSTAYSTWYHQYIAFPIQALTAAVRLGEYTLTDRGTFLTVSQNLTDQLTVFKAATDNLDDPLLNPAHMLISSAASNTTLCRHFAEWIIWDQGGQEVIRNFAKNGQVLYSEAPSAAEIANYTAQQAKCETSY